MPIEDPRSLHNYPPLQAWLDRAAAAMLGGCYEAPTEVPMVSSKCIKPLYHATYTQTERIPTRTVALHNGAVDVSVPSDVKRDIIMPSTCLPSVRDLPALSLTELYQANLRLDVIISRLEHELMIARKEQTIDARNNDSESISSGIMTSKEWETRMLNAVTSRMKNNNREFEEKFSRSDAIKNSIQRHYLFPTDSLENLEQLGDGAIIPQQLTPAVNHALKMLPMIDASAIISQPNFHTLDRGMEIIQSTDTSVFKKKSE